MNNFNTIYKILSYLEKAMDYDTADVNRISPTALGISENRWVRLILMLAEEGYIKGVKHFTSSDIAVSCSNPKITLKGLEYLSENSLMRKAADIAKGVIDIVK